MAVFNFTVNCPASPTPTPTPTPTPCPCDTYSIENVGGSPRTVSYSDCRGISRTIPVSGGNLVEIFACSVTEQANIIITNLGTCSSPDTPTPTPTNTPTPTPTVTIPPTATPIPTYTVTVYASFTGDSARTVNTDGPGGSGVETAARAYYWLGPPTAGVNTLLGGNITSKSCNLLGTVTGVNAGSTFYIGMLSFSYNIPILFTASTTTCVVSSPLYCGTVFTLGGGAEFTITGNTTIYLNAVTQEYSDNKSGAIFKVSLSYCSYDYIPNNTF